MSRVQVRIIGIFTVIALFTGGVFAYGNEKKKRDNSLMAESTQREMYKEAREDKEISEAEGAEISGEEELDKQLEQGEEKEEGESVSLEDEEEKEVLLRDKIYTLKPVKRIAVGKDFILNGVRGISETDSDDPGLKAQWAVGYTNSYSLWGTIDQKRKIRVAVVDTGVDYNHPDLRNRVNKKLGYDFINDDDDPMDDNGHGTHVSGIIGAEMNNGIGITGIVGELDLEIIPVKVLDDEGSGSIYSVCEGIKYSVDMGVDIINLSLGGIGENEIMEEAIEYAVNRGVLVVAASGNERSNCDGYMPAAVKGVYTVGAVDLLNRSAVFSNYGSTVDISAPGVKILSSVPGGGYEAWDGTSMATPVVSGIAAMILAENPQLEMDKLKDILDKSARDIMSEGRDDRSGWGIIDAAKAYELLKLE